MTTQPAWGNESVDQTKNRVERFARGHEQLAQPFTGMLANPNNCEFGEGDTVDAKQSVETLLKEVERAERDQHRVRRGVNMLKGRFAPIATGAADAESAEADRIQFELLGTSLPF